MSEEKNLIKLVRAEKEIERAIKAIENLTEILATENNLHEGVRSSFAVKCRRAQAMLQDLFWRLQELEHKLQQ
jgi:hypothetical protein